MILPKNPKEFDIGCFGGFWYLYIRGQWINHDTKEKAEYYRKIHLLLLKGL